MTFRYSGGRFGYGDGGPGRTNVTESQRLRWCGGGDGRAFSRGNLPTFPAFPGLRPSATVAADATAKPLSSMPFPCTDRALTGSGSWGGPFVTGPYGFS